MHNHRNLKRRSSSSSQRHSSKEVVGYERLSKIGEGTYGIVYKAREKSSGRIVALKRVGFDSPDEGLPSTLLREISLLRTLDHPNIIKLNNVIPCDTRFYLVFEHQERDLKKLLDSRSTGLPIPIVKHYLKQIFNGLSHCHSRMVMHRDLKPHNLLVNSKDNIIKIADFGLARSYCVPVKPYSPDIVTLWYRAPEIMLGARMYGTAIDNWSVGCIFAEMLTKTPLFSEESEIAQLYSIFRTLGTPNDEVWPGVSFLKHYNVEFPNWKPTDLSEKLPMLDSNGIELLMHLLEYNPNHRLAACDALGHPFFIEAP